MKSKKCKQCRFVAFPLIVAASQGDVEAMNGVLQYYEGYITSLSTRTLYDEFGNPHICVDENIRRRLQTKLIAAILKFELA